MSQRVKLSPGYEIAQSDDYFKLSQDSVLLSSFVSLNSDERGLDLGAGIGVLGVLTMMRDKGSMDGVEIEPGALRLAEENYAACGMQGRGRLVCCDFRSLPADMVQRYDVCVANPPYYNPLNGQIAAQPSLATARSSLNGTIEDLCKAASRALKTGGRFYLCYKPSALEELMTALRKNLLAPKRLRLVHHTPKKRANLVLLEARRDRSCELTVMPPLFIADEEGFNTPEYKKIYGSIE